MSALSDGESVCLTNDDSAGVSGYQAGVWVPIFSDGALWGAVNFSDSARERRFDADTFAFLRSAARIFAEQLIRGEKAQAANEAVAAHKRDSEASTAIFETLTNGLDALLLATVFETGELLYANDNCLEFFGAGGDYRGKICYEFLHGRTQRCDDCPYLLLAEQPDRKIQWEPNHPERGRIHRMTSVVIDWPGGKRAQLDFGMDVTQSVRQQETLEKILSSLDAVILATNAATGEILFANEKIKEFFGVEETGVGKICYEHLQNKTERCEHCASHELLEAPDQIVHWDPKFPVKNNRKHQMTSMLIDWHGGILAQLNYGVDVTESIRQRETLESILDTLDSCIFVTDLDTDEILYINDKMKDGYHVDDSIKGDKCWRHIQSNQTRRCEFCRKPQLVADSGQSVSWEDDNPVSNSVMLHIDRIIDWPGGRKVHMQQSIDITETKLAQAALEKREKTLAALNNAAIKLIMRSNEPLDDAMTQGVSFIAETFGIDRVSVSRNTEKPDGLYATQIYRWSKEKGASLEPLEELITLIPGRFRAGETSSRRAGA